MKRRHFVRAALSTIVLALLTPAQPHAQENRAVVVFAAASMKNALDEFAAEWSKIGGTGVKISYAASSALAKQIENGAPADIFLSADRAWMDYLEKQRLLHADTRQDLLGNTLVLVAHRDSKIGSVIIQPGFDLAGLLGGGRLAVGAVDAVPAGRYAKAALEKLGLYKPVEQRLAQAENVRVALAYVARGEAPLGIVYATDAAPEPQVKIIGTFPKSAHPAIVYPVARLAASKHEKADDFLKSLASSAAQTIFRKHGFTALTPGKPQ